MVFICLGLQQLFPQQDSLRLTEKDSIVSSYWLVGLGINIVDDSGDAFNDFTTIKDQWNMVPYPSRVNIGRYFRNGLGLEAIAAYNRYREGYKVDGQVNSEVKDYFSLDSRLSYDLNKLIGETGWFDPYIGAGVGYTDANDLGRGTYNAVFGFRTWFSDHWGLDLNTSGKWSFGNEATNHIQHAAGVTYRFNIKKELSKKGEEKLALIQEQQRVSDSIAAAKKVEEEARALAERLEHEQEAARLVAEEKARQEAEDQRRKALQQAIDDMGHVYFVYNSSYLNSKAKSTLEQLAGFMEQNPNLVLKVTGHADSRGSDKYNQWLSERRARHIVAFIQDQGIDGERLQTEALGESQLTNECKDGIYCTEEKHSRNRRGGFVILNYGF
jgi:outer membrane protein OmpA-like peptidoglycan-associated protein